MRIKCRPRLSARHGSIFLFVLSYVIVAAASFNGSYARFGLREGDPRASFRNMVDGVAPQPFVYRQLLPIIANGIDDNLPSGIKSRLQVVLSTRSKMGYSTLSGLRLGDADVDKYTIRYHLIYYLAFAALLGAMLCAHRIAINAKFCVGSAYIAPILFVLILPWIFSGGGGPYFYDFSELFFIFLSLLLAQSKARWLLIPTTLLAMLNKESFLIFEAALPIIYIRRAKDIPGFGICVLSMIGGIAIYFWDHWRFRRNGGVSMEFHLMENLKFYLNPMSLTKFDKSYGLPFFSVYSLASVVAIAVLIFNGSRSLDARQKWMYIALLSVNVPLLIVYCAPGELRDLSLLYPILFFLILAYIDRAIGQAPRWHEAGFV